MTILLIKVIWAFAKDRKPTYTTDMPSFYFYRNIYVHFLLLSLQILLHCLSSSSLAPSSFTWLVLDQWLLFKYHSNCVMFLLKHLRLISQDFRNNIPTISKYTCGPSCALGIIRGSLTILEFVGPWPHC